MTEFESEDLLREALEEVANAPPGSYVEEPWGSAALAAAEVVAAHGGRDPELVRLASAAVERVADSSDLRDPGEADSRPALDERIADRRRRLA